MGPARLLNAKLVLGNVPGHALGAGGNAELAYVALVSRVVGKPLGTGAVEYDVTGGVANEGGAAVEMALGMTVGVYELAPRAGVGAAIKVGALGGGNAVVSNEMLVAEENAGALQPNDDGASYAEEIAGALQPNDDGASYDVGAGNGGAEKVVGAGKEVKSDVKGAEYDVGGGTPQPQEEVGAGAEKVVGVEKVGGGNAEGEGVG
jgi:hypothetical protein